MAQITIEGSRVTPSTFLRPGARITVEQTPYINKLLARGYVVRVPDPPAAAHVEQVVETQREAAKNEQQLSAPAESAAKSVWAEFLGIEDPSHMTKAEMIEQWNSRGSHSPSVD